MNPHPGQLTVIVGATGTGKSALSLDLAEHLRNQATEAEIVNADALQLYRGMNIGTAKLPHSDRRNIPHHLFDALHITEEATVAWYQPTARALLAEKLAAGTHMILVGGSGLYVSSVIYDFQFPPRDPALRAELETTLALEGVDVLFARLRELAPAVADAVDARNPRRVVRALEVAELGGDAQVVLPTAPELWHPHTRVFGVHIDRAPLVERLDARARSMWADGLLDEVRELIPQGFERGTTASQAIGYAQALAEIRGECTSEEAIAQTQLLTRRYARRQVSWFKRTPEITWLDGPNLHQLLEHT